jgi:uncharacterized protein YacL
MSLWVIRILFLLLCVTAGYAVSQYRPDLVEGGIYGTLIGFGLGGVVVGLDHILKGFSLRAFSAATFGLLLGTIVAWLIDRTQLFIYTEPKTQWVVRLGLFLAFGYLGMILALRSNKDDFSLIIPYVRFRAQSRAEELVVLDTSVIIDGRIQELVEHKFVEGTIVVPHFVLKELQRVADAPEATRRARGRRGLEILHRLRASPRNQVEIHEADIPEEQETDAKLLRLTRLLGARLYTTDFNLSQVADLRGVPCVNLATLANALKPVILPGQVLSLRLVREGKDKGQGVGYCSDGTMVVVNQAQPLIGQSVQVEVTSLVQTGAGVIIFAELRPSVATT